MHNINEKNKHKFYEIVFGFEFKWGKEKLGRWLQHLFRLMKIQSSA